MRKNGPRHVHDAEEVDVELLLDLLPRDGFEQAVLTLARIVDERVDLSETCDPGRNRQGFLEPGPDFVERTAAARVIYCCQPPPSAL